MIAHEYSRKRNNCLQKSVSLCVCIAEWIVSSFFVEYIDSLRENVYNETRVRVPKGTARFFGDSVRVYVVFIRH